MSITLGGVLTAVKAVRLWKKVKPIKRAKTALKLRKLRKAVTNGDDPMNEQVQSVLRSILKTVGGGLVSSGAVSGGELEILAGAASILVGLAWSWYTKRNVA